MKIRSASLALVVTLLVTLHCGPDDPQTSGLDPEETFTAFCETLFTCPEFGAMNNYGSQEGCEDVRLTSQDRDVRAERAAPPPDDPGTARPKQPTNTERAPPNRLT